MTFFRRRTPPSAGLGRPAFCGVSTGAGLLLCLLSCALLATLPASLSADSPQDPRSTKGTDNLILGPSLSRGADGGVRWGPGRIQPARPLRIKPLSGPSEPPLPAGDLLEVLAVREGPRRVTLLARREGGGPERARRPRSGRVR